VKTTANTLIPGLLAITVTAMTVTAMTAGNPASAGDVQTVPVTFALAIDSRDLPDEDEDGIPDIPDFTSDDLIGILIGRVEGTAVSTFNFAGGSNTCGEYNVSGTSWLRQVQQAKILRKGRGPSWRPCMVTTSCPLQNSVSCRCAIPSPSMLAGSKTIAVVMQSCSQNTTGTRSDCLSL
jgi:hypothetical protein